MTTATAPLAPQTAVPAWVSAGPPPVLSVEDVAVRFGKLLAVDHVRFELRGGDLLGLLGVNGAGKTTLMRAICGLQAVRAGDVRVLGEVLTDTSDHLLRQIGFTPDTPPLYDGLTVRQFLRFIGNQYDLTAADTDERIHLWLEKLWLTEKADTAIKGLSRGMRQRIGIARTLLPNPALVVLDEPAAGLDPNGRVQFRNLLGDLRQQGKALIVSSHVLSDLAEQCTHIGLMQGGRMTRFEPIGTFVGIDHGDHARHRVTLARRPAELKPFLAGLADFGVTAIELQDDDLILQAPKSPAAAARLLAELVRRRLPVASFAPVAINLEQAYLRASGIDA